MIDAAGLRVMRAIADEGSFTAAAASLGYSQPAVSQMVRRLEERTGTVLVERLGRSVRLTQAGQVLARAAGPVLTALDAAESEVAAIAGLQAGRVRLAAFPSAASTIVPKALALVRERYPEVQVTLTEAEPEQSYVALRQGQCDLVLGFTYEGDPAARTDELLEGLVSETLMDEEVHLALSRDHPLAGRKGVTMKELADQTWIAGCPRCRGHLLCLAEEAGFSPQVAFETEDFVTVLSLVAEDLGVALVPELILRSISNDRTATLPITPAHRRTVSAVTTPDLHEVPAVDVTLKAVHEAVASLREST